jgi:hypothetical protein
VLLLALFTAEGDDEQQHTLLLYAALHPGQCNPVLLYQ